MSLLQERSHPAGRRWNISGSVIAAFEPFLLSLSDDIMTLWDRREGCPVHKMPVKSQVLGAVAALRNVRAGQNIYRLTLILMAGQVKFNISSEQLKKRVMKTFNLLKTMCPHEDVPFLPSCAMTLYFW